MVSKRAAAERPASSRRSQIERSAEAEQRLILAARQVLSRKGWVGMTLAEVGAEAGYSRGLATHYFGNKAGLLRALTSYINESFMDALRAAPPAKPGLDAVTGFIAVYLGRKDPAWTNTRALLLLLAEALLDATETGPSLAEYNRDMVAYLESNFTQGIENGEVRPDLSPAFCASFVIGSLRGMMLQHLLSGGPIQAREIQERLIELVRHAVAIHACPPSSNS